MDQVGAILVMRTNWPLLQNDVYKLQQNGSQINVNNHELIFASTTVEAVGKLRQDDFDLLMIGVHFDESRMFELLSQCTFLIPFLRGHILAQ